MPLPKLSKYVRDGEVDPGIQAWAEASLLLGTAGEEGFGGSRGYGKLARNNISTLNSWFMGSCGLGVFTVARDPKTGNWNGVIPSRFDSETDVRGKSLKSVDPRFTDLFPEEEGLVNDRPQYEMIAGHYFKNESTYLSRAVGIAMKYAGKGLRENPFFNYWNTKYAAEVYATLYKSHPRRELIVEALMFYDPVGFFGEFLDKNRNQNAYEHGLYIAEITASGVPVLGKQWIVFDLKSRGVDSSEALATAEATYASGSNYVNFKRYMLREDVVRAILVKYDPSVPNALVETVAQSPLPIDQVLKFAESTFPPPEPEPEVKNDVGKSGSVGTGSLVTAAGTGALAALLFGGPIGLAVGAAVLFLGSRSKS